MKWTWNKKVDSDIYWDKEYASPVEVELPSEITEMEKHEAVEIIEETLNKLGDCFDVCAEIKFDKDRICVFYSVTRLNGESESVELGYFKEVVGYEEV